MRTKTTTYIIDSSAILSGRPLNLPQSSMYTTQSVADEFTPSGRDYQIFELLKEQGLIITHPSSKSINRVKATAKNTGDLQRLSATDIELLALALDLQTNNAQVQLLTDDYSIQNVAHTLKINYISMAQKQITKKFKWICRCPGCKRSLKDYPKTCPICGTETKLVIKSKKDILSKSK